MVNLLSTETYLNIIILNFKFSKHSTLNIILVKTQAVGRTMAVVFFQILNGQFSVYWNLSQHYNIKFFNFVSIPLLISL